MQELGVIANVESISGLSFSMDSGSQDDSSFARALVCHDRALVVEHDDPGKKLEIPIYPITRLGREVFQLGKFRAHEPYLGALGQFISTQGFRVILANWRGVIATSALYSDGEVITGYA
jgi:hypothetical protein